MTIFPRFFAPKIRLMQIRLFPPAVALAKTGVLFPILFIAVFLSPSSLFSQIEDPKGIFRELRALEGTWFMPTDRGDRLESWRIQDDSTLIGRGFRIKPENGDTVILENLRLELRDTTITYIAIARGQNQNKPIPF